jgi:hypothetical protein
MYAATDNAYTIFLEDLMGRDNLLDTDIGGRIILSWMLNRI